MSELRDTSHGPVLGFIDTLPQRKETAYNPLESDKGAESPLLKWLGIPYGEARRFEHVRPPTPWSQPLECYDFGPMPMQPQSYFNATMTAKVKSHISRDQHLQAEEGVHTVNVFAPHGLQEGDKLPILVWIYGGSLNTGSAGLHTSDATNWLRRSIRDGKPFIFVSGNYRTNVFGFLAHDDLRQADPRGLAGNYGLRDALAIFKWVQDNIAAFGGDPDRVTGFGESAGAFLISQLLYTNANPAVPKRRTMRRAIMQSGAPATLAANRIENAYPLYTEMLQHFGIDEATPQERVESLRLVPFTELSRWVNNRFQLGQWTLTIEEGEHAIWNESTVSLLEKGVRDESIEAVITGINEHEGSMFSSQLQTPEAYSAMLSRFPDSVRPAIEKLYPTPSSPATPEQVADSSAAQLLGDRIFEAPCLRFAEQYSMHTPTYLYKLRGGVHAIIDALQCGIIHTQDLHLLFNLHNYWSADSEEARLSKAMGDAWVDFATSGQPGRDWDRYEGSKPAWLVFKQDGTTEMEDIAGYKEEQTKLWTRMQIQQASLLSSSR